MPSSKHPIVYASLEQPGYARIELGCRAGYGHRHSRGHNDWLMIHGRISSPDGAWKFADQSLDVTELLELIAWLRTGPDLAQPELAFTEPCLAFAMAPLPATAGPPAAMFAATFRGEAAPPWLWGNDEATWRQGYTLKLRVLAHDIQRFAEELAAIGR